MSIPLATFAGYNTSFIAFGPWEIKLVSQFAKVQFKQINDTFGHSVGDTILIDFSIRLSRRLTGKHVFARISGDEFILVGVDPCDRIEGVLWSGTEQDARAEPVFTVHGKDIVLAFSKGMATYPEDGETADAAIACADKRMHTDKRVRYKAEKRRRHTEIHERK